MIARRNVLTMLGLATAGSAIAAEDFIHEGHRFVSGEMKMRELPIVSGSATSAEQMVAALRKLADEIENHTVIIEAIDVSTALRSQEVIRQKVSFELLLVDPKTA